MVLTVGAESAKINLRPASIAEEIIQNLRTLLSTPKYSVPLDREFGIPWDAIDKPIEAAQSLLIGEIMDAVELYEPRAVVEEITFTRDEMTGRLIPKLKVVIESG
jgi:phage baseplate assembly protein W